MSSLIFDIDTTRAIVITDTLAVRPDGTPFFFMSKAHHLPHLRMIIAGTGHGPFLDDWQRTINTGLLVRDVENLDQHAPRRLRKAWERVRDEGEPGASETTTVYHFGVSERAGEIVAFAYRSTNDFRSERLPAAGYGIKPQIDPPAGDPLQQIPEIMAEQRRRQAEMPEAERVYVGGEAVAMQLTPEGCMTWRLFRFDDFENHMAAAAAYSGLKRP